MAVTIGGFLVVCSELSSSILYVGTHAVSRHIQSNRGDKARGPKVELDIKLLYSTQKEVRKRSHIAGFESLTKDMQYERQQKQVGHASSKQVVFAPNWKVKLKERKRSCTPSRNNFKTAPKREGEDGLFKTTVKEEGEDHNSKASCRPGTVPGGCKINGDIYYQGLRKTPPTKYPELSKDTHTRKLQLSRSKTTSTGMDAADELFLSQFAVLNHQQAVDLPLDIVNTCDWNLCARQQ